MASHDPLVAAKRILAPSVSSVWQTRLPCHADPPQLHGPYYPWTAKADGTRPDQRLREHQALTRSGSVTTASSAPLIAQMRGVSAKATERIKKDTSTKARSLIAGRVTATDQMVTPSHTATDEASAT